MMCCIMFAKFHNLHEKNNPGTTPFANELRVVADEIESCIKGLQCSQQELHNLLLIGFSGYPLKPQDILVFKSIRIIMYALHFLHVLVGGEQSIGGCIAKSWEHIYLGLHTRQNSPCPGRLNLG